MTSNGYKDAPLGLRKPLSAWAVRAPQTTRAGFHWSVARTVLMTVLGAWLVLVVGHAAEPTSMAQANQIGAKHER